MPEGDERWRDDAGGAQALAESGSRRRRRRVTSESRPGGALAEAPTDLRVSSPRDERRSPLPSRDPAARSLTRRLPSESGDRRLSSGSVEILLPPEVLAEPTAPAPELELVVVPEAGGGAALVALSLALASGALLVSGGWIAARGEGGAGGVLVAGGTGLAVLALVGVGAAARERPGVAFALASLISLLDLALASALLGLGG